MTISTIRRMTSTDWVSIASVTVVFGAWELLARVGLIDSSFFPPPSWIIGHLTQLLLFEADFRTHLGTSLYRLAIGLCIATPLGVAFGLTAGLNELARSIIHPFAAMVYPMPKVALFPFLLLLFGTGDASKIALIASGAFFIIFLNTLNGVQQIHASGYLGIAEVFKIPFFRRLVQVVIRGSLPAILNGIKMGFGYGMVMMVAAEFTVSRWGLGVFLWNSWDQFRILDLYASFTCISLMGLLIFGFFDALIAASTYRVE